MNTIDDIHVQRLGKKDFHLLEPLNYAIFKEARVINRTDHDTLVILMAMHGDVPVGFKIGYNRRNGVFYSAKGGVLPQYRRKGVAAKMLGRMILEADKLGFKKFIYDTFPNMNPGMLILGLNSGFKVIEAKYNAQYKDFQVSLEKELSPDYSRIN